MAENKGKLVWEINAILYNLFMSDVHKHLYNDVLKALGPLENIKIDDIGCGTGKLIKFMPKTAIIRGIDYSKQAIIRAKNECKGHPKVTFLIKDFYSEIIDGYKPDKVVACRSLYYNDLSLSLSVLSAHLGEEGLAVVAHPKPDWKEYVGNNKLPIKNKLVQIIKSIGRVSSKILGYPYNLFQLEEFDRCGRQHFDSVECGEAGLGTHYIIRLEKGNGSENRV